MLSKLGMTTEQVSKVGPVTLHPSGSKGPGALHNEYICTFPTKEIRDMIRGNASKLGLLPKDSAGIRLELPDYLQNNFKVLQNAAYQIKTRNPGCKRNVLFDDDNLDLALDIKLSDADDWRRISPGDARTAGARATGGGGSGASKKRLNPDSISSMMGGSSST